VGEVEPAVANFGEAAVLAEADAFGSRQELAGELPGPLFGIEAAGERAVVLAKPLDVAVEAV